MVYVLNFIIGFALSFIGYFPPGMINMTAVKLSLERGLMAGRTFSLGAAVTVGIQLGIAILGAHFLKRNEAILDGLSTASIPIFFLLSGYFFWQSRRDIKNVQGKSNDRYFFSGMGISFLNMIAIPFYVYYTAFLSSEGYIEIDSLTQQMAMILGVGIGAFCIFYAYALKAQSIKKKASFIARNINLILSILLFVIALSFLYRTF